MFEGCLCIGHAGAGASALPNTLKSLELVLDLGVDMVEFDVRPGRDELVLRHDDHFSHPSGVSGLVSQHSLTVDDVSKMRRL